MRSTGVLAMLGGALWAVKSLAILITGDQPEYLFEVAPAALGLAILGLTLMWRAERGPARSVVRLGMLAAIAGPLAAVMYVIDGDDEGLFGPAVFIWMVTATVLLFRMGRPWWRMRNASSWRAVPYLLAWASVLMIPIGGALSSIDERLLEVPLVIVAGGWIALGALLTTARPESARI